MPKLGATISTTDIATDGTQREVPTTGATINITSPILLIDPAGSLVALTVNLPGSPVDGDQVTVSTSQIITTLTLGGTIVGTLTTLALGGFAKFIYNSTAAKWFRIG